MKVTDKCLRNLAITAVVMLAVTTVVLTGGNKSPKASFRKGSNLIQGLDTAEISSIKITEKKKSGEGYDSVTITRKKGEELFTVSQKNNFPASVDDLNHLLEELLDIRCAAVLADNPEDAAKWGVTADAPKTGTIELQDAEGKLLLKVIAGETFKGKRITNGTAVTTGNKIYRSESPVSFSGLPMSYIDQTLYKVDSKKVKSIQINRNKEKYSYVQKNGSLELKEIPEGKEANTSVTWAMVEGFTRITFDNVFTVQEVTFTPALTAQVSMDDGLVYGLSIGKDKDGKYYLKAAAIKPDKNNLKKEQLPAFQKAHVFNNMYSNWIYQLSDWDAKRLDKPLKDLLKDIKKEDKAGGNKTPKSN